MPFPADIIYYDSSGREQCSRIAPDTEWIWQDGRVENPRIGIELSWYWSGDTQTVPLEALYESGAGRLKDLILLPDFLAGNEGDGQSLILPYGCGALVHTKGHRRGEMMIGGSSSGWRSHERFRHHQRSSNKSNVRRGGRYDMLFRLRTCFGPERLYALAPVFRVRDHAADSPLSDRISLHLGDFDGDYAAMAHWYGDYMRRHYAIRPLRETAGKSPLMEYGSRAIAMRVRLACKQMPSPIHEQTHDHQPELNVFMTFENVRMTLEECRKQNVGPLECCLVGWNCGGHDGAYPQLFPVEERIGGESERKKTLETAKELGSRIGLHDNYFDSYTIADSFRWENVNRNADQLPSLSGIWGGGQSYIVCPKHSYENARRNLRQTPALGINGFYFIDVLTVWPLEKCCSKAHPLTRRTCAIGRKKNLKYVHDLFGGIMSEGGRDWALPELDRIYDLIDTPNMPDWCDAEIPLYQMVWHGTVIYNTYRAGINSHPGERIYLRNLAFGGLPTIYWHYIFSPAQTAEGGQDPGKDLRFNPSTLSCEISRIRAISEDVRRMEDVRFAFITAYREYSQDQTETVYSNGCRCLVNYGSVPWKIHGIIIPPRNFEIWKGKE